MNPKDTKALELIRDFLVHHDAETNVGAKIAVSGERLMRVRIVRKPPRVAGIPARNSGAGDGRMISSNIETNSCRCS